jgi:hypothetical protein
MNDKIKKVIIKQAKLQAEQKKQDWIKILKIEDLSYDGIYPSEKDFFKDSLVEIIKDILWFSFNKNELISISDKVINDIDMMAIRLTMNILNNKQ